MSEIARANVAHATAALQAEISVWFLRRAPREEV